MCKNDSFSLDPLSSKRNPNNVIVVIINICMRVLCFGEAFRCIDNAFILCSYRRDVQGTLEWRKTKAFWGCKKGEHSTDMIRNWYIHYYIWIFILINSSVKKWLIRCLQHRTQVIRNDPTKLKKIIKKISSILQSYK